MLKRLAILGLLVLVNGARSQVPRNGSGQHDKAQDKQETANPSKPVVVVDSQHGADNQEQAPEKPTKYPWGELLAPANIPNWFLVAVGGITGWFVYKTLRAIKKQAGIMETQAKDARESGAEAIRIALATAKAAQESVQAAVAQMKAAKERERARLGIRTVDIPEVSGPERVLDGMCPLRVCAFVENFGHSKAFNVRAYGILDIVSDPESCPLEKGFLQYFPQIIDEGPKQHPLKLGGFGREFEGIASTGDALTLPEEMVQGIRDGKVFIQASGKIDYEDIFGDFHRVPFRFVWKSLGDDAGGKWLTRSFWLDCNPPSDEQDDPDDMCEPYPN